MSMKRCDNGHFYDTTKHSTCPWCGVKTDADLGRTAPVRNAQEGSQDAAVTRALHREPSGISPVVGWLVCVDGPDRGRDYRLHSEKNFIGRSSNMDICIAGDDSISREKHATVSFEPKKKEFWLLPGEASGLVYINEEVVNTPTPLKPRDIIELGRTKVMFYPFCDENFQWS